MAMTGEKPGKGIYVCNNYGETVALDDHDDTLPQKGIKRDISYNG